MNIRQTFNTIRQEKLFSTIYIVGTALAITFTMILSLIYYINLADIRQEPYRSRTLYIDEVESYTYDNPDKHFFSQLLCEDMEKYIYPLKDAEIVCGTMSDIEDYNLMTIDTPHGKKRFRQIKTDPNFFRIYPYTFISGKPFIWEDLHTNSNMAVITDHLAETLFGKGVNAIGKEVKTVSNVFLDEHTYRVCGVVKRSSSLLPRSYAEIFTPYHYVAHFDGEIPHFGSIQAIIVAKDRASMDRIKKELQEVQRKWNVARPTDSDGRPFTFIFADRNVISHIRATLASLSGTYKRFGNTDYIQENKASLRLLLLVFLILLIVPSINLCGMVSSRMEERMAEMGIRKSFGASRGTLFRQVLSENLALTLCGGILGLLLSWIVLGVGRVWLFSLFMNPVVVRECPDLTGSMLFAPIVFLTAFLLCCVLNLLAALIPTWWNLRKPIVESMMREK